SPHDSIVDIRSERIVAESSVTRIRFMQPPVVCFSAFGSIVLFPLQLLPEKEKFPVSQYLRAACRQTDCLRKESRRLLLRLSGAPERLPKAFRRSSRKDSRSTHPGRERSSATPFPRIPG